MSIDILKEIAKATFTKREGSIWPPQFEDPPATWARRFKPMAEMCGITDSIDAAVEEVRAWCGQVGVVK
ncbi:MAG: hypothetical protein GF350_15575 [Chitinivibrionales bacterium]|nr:hypothetical protein [Chitinivibrionales bacterium]